MIMLPTITCEKCKLLKIVTKSETDTRAWFNKWHFKHCDGALVYRDGIELPPQTVAHE